MPIRSINLTEHFDSFVQTQLESGQYKNASEVIRAGLSLLERADRAEDAKLRALREANAIGLASFEQGDFTEIKDSAELARFFQSLPDDA